MMRKKIRIAKKSRIVRDHSYLAAAIPITKSIIGSAGMM